MLDAEAALARAQARLGVLPRRAAEAIGGAARAGRFDLRALAVAARETANPVVGLVRALTAEVAATDPEAAEYVHRGSTSQDVFDTGAMLVAARVLRLIRADLARCDRALGALAARHRDTVTAGRTLALQAVPTTFGLRAAGWRRLVRDADARLAATLTSLPVSLGGAAGTLAGYLEYARLDAPDERWAGAPAAGTGTPSDTTAGTAAANGTGPGASGGATGTPADPGGPVDPDDPGTGTPGKLGGPANLDGPGASGGAHPESGVGADASSRHGGSPGGADFTGSSGPGRPDYAARLAEAFAAETGLAVPGLPWHALRTPIADLGAALAFTAGALGKLAVDVLTLSRTEIAEVAEPGPVGRGASSAMPHKRNPVLSTMVRAAAIQVPALAAGLTQCLLAEDERSGGAWHAEWQLLRDCLRLTGGAAATAAELTEGLRPDPDRMRANLARTGALAASERVAAVLAPHLGKAAARVAVSAATEAARDTGQPLPGLLAADPLIAKHLSARRIAELCDPAAYTGAAGALVDRALSE
jgi:3-carboxy-cis,cis-muconate cycloisomerase